MNFHGSCIRLFETNTKEIKNFISNLTEDDWNLWNHRQKSFDVHKKTKSYPLRWAEYQQDELVINLKNHSESISFLLKPIIERLEEYYNGTCVNIMFANLPSGEEIPCHVDIGLLSLVHRCHLPIKTDSDIIFLINKSRFYLEEGYLYEINNTQEHCVKNLSNKDRIHLIIDILPNSCNIKSKFIFE